MEFSEKQIETQMRAQRDEYYGKCSRELAILELEDTTRKGCLLENDYSDSCLGCSAFAKGECPMIDWEKRHPEYRDDSLAQEIKVLQKRLMAETAD